MTSRAELACVVTAMAAQDVTNVYLVITAIRTADNVIVAQLGAHQRFVMQLENAHVYPIFREEPAISVEQDSINIRTVLVSSILRSFKNFVELRLTY